MSVYRSRLGTVALTLVLMVTAAACGGDGAGVATTVPTPEVPAVADGQWTAFVTVGEDETGAVTLGVDLAELLTGEAARQAAVDAGVIGEGEELPNNVFIANPEEVLELLHLVPDAKITVLSGSDPGESILIDEVTFVALYQGTYIGDPVYGFPPHQPILMDVIVLDGGVTEASAVYLP